MSDLMSYFEKKGIKRGNSKNPAPPPPKSQPLRRGKTSKDPPKTQAPKRGRSKKPPKDVEDKSSQKISEDVEEEKKGIGRGRGRRASKIKKVEEAKEENIPKQKEKRGRPKGKRKTPEVITESKLDENVEEEKVEEEDLIIGSKRSIRKATSKRTASQITPSATQEENIQPVAKRRKLKKITKAEEIEVKVPQHIAQPISQNSTPAVKVKSRSRSRTPNKDKKREEECKIGKESKGKGSIKKSKIEPAKKDAEISGISPEEYFKKWSKPRTKKDPPRDMENSGHSPPQQPSTEIMMMGENENIREEKVIAKDDKWKLSDSEEYALSSGTELVYSEEERGGNSDVQIDMIDDIPDQELILRQIMQDRNNNKHKEDLEESKLEDVHVSQKKKSIGGKRDIPKWATASPNELVPKSKKPPTKPLGGKSKEIKATIKPKGGATSSDGVLSGMTFVITGVLDSITRDDLSDFLKSKGGRVTGSVSSKTSYLIVGGVLEDGRAVEESGKHRNAIAKKVRIMNEFDTEAFLKKKLGNESFSLSNALGGEEDVDIDINRDLIISPKISENMEDMLWTDKYHPKGIKELVGNQGIISKLREWVRDWDDVILHGNKKEMKIRKGNFQNIVNPNARAALISGPPGIGKTSAAKLICEELGYDIMLQNASDTRSKKKIEALLTSMTGTHSITQFFGARGDVNVINMENTILTTNRSVIIMDEVDGVSGSDRGGIAALIQVIKNTKSPIICICNDRQSPKVRSLANHCYDLKFTRPQKNTILARILQIANRENLHIQPNAIEYIIEGSGGDLRQVINMLQMWKTTNPHMNYLEVKNKYNSLNKDQACMINGFEAAGKLLKSSECSKLSIREKTDLFFIDFDLIPLLILENYLSPYIQGATGGVKSNSQKEEELERIANTADYISLGDIGNNLIRKQGNWSLLPNMGFLSSVAPATLNKGFLPFPKFPEWFGKMSTTKKTMRQLREIRAAIGLKLYATESNGIEEAIEFMDIYNISMDLFKEHLSELCQNEKLQRIFKEMSTQSKTAFTRKFNAHHQTSLLRVKKKKGPAAVEKEQFDPDVHEMKEEGQDDFVQNDEDEDAEVIEIQVKSKEKKGKSKVTKKKKQYT